MRALHLLALSPAALGLVRCSSSAPSSPAPLDASTLDVPLVHLFDDDYGQLLYAQALDGEVFAGEHLDYREPGLTRALSISGDDPSFSILGSAPTYWDCAALPTGQVVCEGSNVDGDLGSIATQSCYNDCNHTTASETDCQPSDCFTLFGPVCYPCVADWTPLPGVSNLRQVHRGCGVDYDGDVVCWAGDAGKFPGPVRELAGEFAILESGDLYPITGGSTLILSHVVQATSDDWFSNSCALTDDTKVYCWGNNEFGAVGDGTTTARSQPVLVGSDYRQVRTNFGETCAIRTDDTVACWGEISAFNADADAGNCGFETTCVLTPTPISGLSNVKEIAGLGDGFYALLRNGSVVQVSWPPESPTIKTIHPAQ